MLYKTCNKCGQELPATTKYFNRDNSKKDELRPDCKECSKLLRIKNKTKIAAYMKKYSLNHKEELKESHKQWRDNNRQHLREYYKYYYKSSDIKKNCNKRWSDSHKDQVKEYQKNYRLNIQGNVNNHMV